MINSAGLRYSVILVSIPNSKAPFFIGSQIRGVLGYALKRVTCINPKFTCDGCFGSKECLYYEFYELKNSYRNYRLDFRLGQAGYEFGLYLFEDACNSVAYMVSALYIMLSQYGLGGCKFSDFNIFVNGHNVLENGAIILPNELVKVAKFDSFSSVVNLKLITPLRIKKLNRFIRDDSLELRDILISIYDKIQKIQHLNSRYNIQTSAQITNKNLRYCELRRHSNRQKVSMNLGGLIGNIRIENLDLQSYQALKLAEILGVGKQCVFGLGKIEVEDIDGI